MLAITPSRVVAGGRVLVLVGETGDSALEMKRFRDHSRGQAGLGWAGLGWAGLGWAGLGM